MEAVGLRSWGDDIGNASGRGEYRELWARGLKSV